MSTQKPFEPGDRIIYSGDYCGTLIARSGRDVNPHWTVKWDDGAESENVYPESDMVYINGGPSSSRRTVPSSAIAEALRQAADELPFLDRPANMLVRQQDAAAWLRERADGIDS
jgi:hypothetical protein